MKILIIGAGISGLSTAIALKQKGFNVTIYERHPSAQTIGAGIVLWSNASYILNELGLLDAVKKVSSRPQKMKRISDKNDVLGSLDIEIINKEIGFDSYSILRKDFQEILLNTLCKLGVNIHYNHRVEDIISTDDKAHVVFENDKKVTADVIIGADGRMNSQARQYILGDNTPKYQSFINWVGTYTSKEKLFESMDILDYWGVGERFGIVPIDAYTCYWAAGIFSSEIETKNPLKYKDELTKVFQKYSPIVSKIIEESLLKDINKIYLYDHEPVMLWHKHNLVMLGDAAHAALPTSGQGSAQALEDAWHFSNILFEHSSDIELAFQQFTQKRHNKTRVIIQTGRSLATTIFNNNEVYSVQRNEQSKKTDFSLLAKGMAKGWGEGLC
jgi:2-polyprenyl-6-methoxyphenol hydroxylase-like FAD-dependent oxidoreductase